MMGPENPHTSLHTTDSLDLRITAMKSNKVSLCLKYNKGNSWENLQPEPPTPWLWSQTTPGGPLESLWKQAEDISCSLAFIYCRLFIVEIWDGWLRKERTNKPTFLACLNVFEFLLVHAEMSIIYFSVLQCLWLLCHLKVIYNNYIRRQSAINWSNLL